MISLYLYPEKHPDERNNMKKTVRTFSVYLILVLILTLVPSNSAFATDYSTYSNNSKGWGLYSKTDHSTPGGSASSETLKKYDAYYLGDTSRKVCYLSFDCGYEYGNTPSILDTLKKNNVKAVFFLTEHFVRTNPDLVKRMKDEGHLIGNHTSKHKRLPTLSVDSIKSEMKAVEDAVKECTGYTLDKIMRPPEGAYSDRVLKVLQDMGYTTLFWSMAWKDWDVKNQPSVASVEDQFKKHHHNGMVPLMHVISTADTKALPSVIKFLRDTGYSLERFDNVYKANPHLKIKLKDFEYNGKGAKRNLIIKTRSKSRKTVLFYKKGRTKPMKNIPVSAGTYFVEVIQNTTANYREAQAKLKFKIKRATPEVILKVKGADKTDYTVPDSYDTLGGSYSENAVSNDSVSGNTSSDNAVSCNIISDDILQDNDTTSNKSDDIIRITLGSDYSFKVICANKKGTVELKYYDSLGHRIEKPETAGEYRVKASVSGTKNYKRSVSDTYYFTIHE